MKEGRITEGSRNGKPALFLALFGLALLLTFHAPVSAAKKQGWVTKNGHTYYYVKGKRVKGWKTINGKEYYFNSLSRLMKNRIVGNSRGGYDYVDAKGIRVKDPVVRKAAALVRGCTNSSMTRNQKLETAYWWIIQNYVYVSHEYSMAPSNFPSVALGMFSSGGGDCFQSALVMAYVAKVLGYQVRVIYGFVSSETPTPIYTHGWAEVLYGNQYYVYDITMQRRYSQLLHGILIENYPFAIARDKAYYLNITDGVVVWK